MHGKKIKDKVLKKIPLKRIWGFEFGKNVFAEEKDDFLRVVGGECERKLSKCTIYIPLEILKTYYYFRNKMSAHQGSSATYDEIKEFLENKYNRQGCQISSLFAIIICKQDKIF